MSPPDEKAEFRGLVLDVLELIADRDAQLEYQRAVPYVDVPAELFNQWDDAYHPDDSWFRQQFADGELDALAAFAEVLSSIGDQTPQQLPPLDEFVTTPEWQHLSGAALSALAAMNRSWRDGRTPPSR